MVDAPRLPPLSHIRAFEAAARSGSFAGAARELGMTAAAVSYNVRRLEQQVGLALFRRLPHCVELTEPGQALAEDATKAFAVLRASFARAAELDKARLAITCLPTFCAAWLATQLCDFRARHPE